MLKKLCSLALLFGSVILNAQKNEVVHLSSKQFKQEIENSLGTILDVRTHSEYGNGHIENAGQLNYYALDFKKALLLLAKDKPVYLYCNTGYRSAKAAEILMENGYTRVYNLEHGIMEWYQMNYPVGTLPKAKQDKTNKWETKNLLALIKTSDLVFIDFYAPWCAPCRSMMPMIDELTEEYKSRIQIIKVNADASKALIKELGIKTVPYITLYRKNKLIYAKSGIVSKKELSELFDSQLVGNIK